MPEDIVTMTRDEIQAQIEEQAECDIVSLPRMDAIKWFARMPAHEVVFRHMWLESVKSSQDPALDDGKKAIEAILTEQKQLTDSFAPYILRRHHDMPLKATLRIEFMFDAGDELHVYCLPKDASVGAGARYCLSKAENNYWVEHLLIEIWIDEVVRELNDLDEETNPVENAVLSDREAAIRYLRTLPDDYSMKQAADDLEAETHLEEIEEEEEEEEEEEQEETETKAAAPTAPATSAPAEA